MKLSDTEFKRQFVSCEMEESDFTHEAHLRLAWIDITNFGIEKGILEIQDQIWNYVVSLGQQKIYNKTITIAAMNIVYHFMKKSTSDNFIDFIDEFPQLRTNFKGLISAHYSLDIFNDPQAKKEFIEPDLLGFE